MRDCRRADYVAFKAAWSTVQGLDAASMKAGDMDRALHAERVAGRGANRRKPTFTETFGSIPDGAMFHREEADPVALLKWRGRAWAWAPEGYKAGPRLEGGRSIEVLTPRTAVDAIRAGYVPMVHGSAGG